MQTNNLFKLPTNQGIQLISINDIIRIEAISNYSKIYFSNGKTIVVAKVLRWFQEQLSAILMLNKLEEHTLFIRTHRTHLVNKNFIRSYANGKVELHNHQYINVAKRKKVAFLKYWDNCEVAAA
jgi:two-component system, LytTR family, response regulator